MADGRDLVPEDALDIDGYHGFGRELEGQAESVVFRNVELAMVGEQSAVAVEPLHVDLGRVVEADIEALVEVGSQPAKAVTAAERPVVAAVGQLIRAIGEVKRAGGEGFQTERTEGLHRDHQ